MKFIVLLLVFLFAVWLFRSRGRSRNKPHPQQMNVTPRSTEVQAMQACAYCGVHMGCRDMLQGEQSAYCCLEHLQRAGDAPRHG